MSDIDTLDINELAKVLHKTPRTIGEDLNRRPERLPPRLTLPGSRRVLWRKIDVQSWLEKYVKGAV